MLELIDKSPVSIAKHKEYMQNARLIDTLKAINIIKLKNPQLYSKLRLNFHVSKKFELNRKTGMSEYVTKTNMVRAWISLIYLIIQVAGITYYIKK